MKVIFDLDGTLLDSEKHYVRYWMEASRELGYPISRDQALMLRSLESTLCRELFKTWFGEEVDIDRIKRLRTKKMESLTFEAKPGVREVVAYLKEKDIPYCVCSASNAERCHRYMKKAGIDEFFPVLFSATTCSRGKPFPEPYLMAMKAIDVVPEECICVEDSPNGFFSAYSAGARVVFISDLTLPSKEIKEKALACLDSLLELPALLDSLPK